MGLGLVVGLLVNDYKIDWASTKGLLRTATSNRHWEDIENGLVNSLHLK